MRVGNREVNVNGIGSTIVAVIVIAICVWLVYFVIEVSRAVGVWPAS